MVRGVIRRYLPPVTTDLLFRASTNMLLRWVYAYFLVDTLLRAAVLQHYTTLVDSTYPTAALPAICKRTTRATHTAHFPHLLPPRTPPRHLCARCAAGGTGACWLHHHLALPLPHYRRLRLLRRTTD